jgi:hypothetical protein
MIHGSGAHRYRVVRDWGLGPEGREFGGVLPGLAVDEEDRVYIARRSPPAILVYSREGAYIDTWGEEILQNPHALTVADDGAIWVADVGDHTARKFSAGGELLMTLGTPGVPGAPGAPFNMPTKVAIAPSGDIFVSDGYGQARVHRFAPDGVLVKSWGAPGAAPGQFHLPHSVSFDPYGRLLVVDRENCRIQIFDQDGGYLGEWSQQHWPGIQWPMEAYVHRNGLVYLAEAAFRVSIWRHSRSKVFSPVHTPAGEWEMLARWGDTGSESGQFQDCPHAICADSWGDIYVTEVPFQPNRIQKFERVE